MIFFKYIFIFLTLLLGRVLSDGDFQEAVDGFIESFDDLVPEYNSKTSTEEISYEGQDPVSEPPAITETVQLLGDDYEFDITSNVWEKAKQELEKISTDLQLVNVTKFIGQVTNDVVQAMHLIVAKKSCTTVESCQYPCVIELTGKKETAQSNCADSTEKREKRNTKMSIRRTVDPDEAEKLADFAANTLDMFDVDNNKRIVKEVITATKQLSEGVLYDLVMRVAVVNCDEGSTPDSCNERTEGPENLCKVKIYRSFENSSTFKLTQSDCTPISAAKLKSIQKKKRFLREALVGGYMPQDVNSDLVKSLAGFYTTEISKGINCKNCIELDEIIKVESQVVAGVNYRMKLRIKNTSTNEVMECNAVVWEKAWENFRQLTSSDCGQWKKIVKKNKRELLGGWKEADVKDSSIQQMANFSMKAAAAAVNAKNAKLIEIISAKTQLVNGRNVNLTLKVKGSNEDVYICGVSLYEQSWTNTLELTKIECNPVDRKNREVGPLVGGWSTADVNDDYIKKVANFSVEKVSQKMNTCDVKMVKIISAKKQVVSGINTRMTLKMVDSNKVNYLCDVSVYDQPWTNTLEVNNIACSPEADDRKKRSTIVGGWKTVDVDDPYIKEMADFSMTGIGQSINSPGASWTGITSAKTQVVAGTNMKLTMTVKDDNKAVFNCFVSLFDQPWTNTRRITAVQCNPTKKKASQTLGGWNTAEVNDPFIKEVADFSVSKVSQSINAPGVTLFEIMSARTQVVSGRNIQLALKMIDDNEVKYLCDVTVYDQPWTKTRKVTSIGCSSVTQSRKKRSAKNLLGGWKTADVNDPYIKKMADFSMPRIRQTINSKPPLNWTEITSAQTQMVSGTNTALTMTVKDGNNVAHSCNVKIYDQPWTNTKQVTDVQCIKSSDRKKRADNNMLGGWKDADVDDQYVKGVVDFGASKISQSINAKGVKMLKILSCKYQVVSGRNFDLKLRMVDDSKVKYLCDVIVYDQPWTNTREITNMTCNPESASKKKRNDMVPPGGWNTADVNDDFIKQMADFSMTRVGQSINSKQLPKCTKITSAKTQVVAGIKVDMTMTVKDHKGASYNCRVKAFSQPWTNTQEVTEVQCIPA